MAKFSRHSKLSKAEQTELILEFCNAVVLLQNPREAAKFLSDLLSGQELEMLAKRIKIAKLLLADEKYADISRKLKVSHGTIARVNAWLLMAGEGYRLIVERIKSKR